MAIGFKMDPYRMDESESLVKSNTRGLAIVVGMTIIIFTLVGFTIGRITASHVPAAAMKFDVRILEKKSTVCVDTLNTLRQEKAQCEYSDATLTYGKTDDWWWYLCKCKK